MKVQMKRLGFLVSLATMQVLLPSGVCVASSGHDWYCPDPEAHAQFEKHLQQYHNQDSEEVVAMLSKVFGDDSLSAEEKTAQTTDIIKTFATKIKLGEGD